MVIIMVNIIETNRFKLFQLDDNIIVFSYKDCLQKLEFNLNDISNNTANTWENNRNKAEINKNTLQGKIVEEFFIDLMHYENKNNRRIKLSFISYDEFRKDSFKKHAPFDGIIFEEGNSNVGIAISRINSSISSNSSGQLDDITLAFCRSNRIYSVEIKSSKIPDKIYESSGDNLHKVYSQLNLINQLKQLDLFKYPKFNRKDGGEIHNAESYLCWVKRNVYSMQDKSDKEIINSEINSSLDIYTRVFIDDKLINKRGKELFIGYFLGYVLGYEFYENFNIMNFPSHKSQKAIYVTYPISQSKSFSDLFEDTRLWQD